MYRRIQLFLMTACLLILAGCVLGPQLTPLEIQELQTRTFSASKRPVFESSVTTLQDMGYIVESANFDTGFITARSLARSGFATTSNNNLTVFIRDAGEGQTNVRINVVQSSQSLNDGGRSDRVLYDPDLYQALFTHIEQNIFTRNVL